MSDKMQLVVATPCFGGQVSSIYASSIFALQRAATSPCNSRRRPRRRPMRREPSGMSAGASPLSVSGRTFDGGSRYRLRDLFTPLETLLVSGGDPRLALDPEDCVSALDPAQAQRNVQHVLDRIAHVLVKIELLLDRGMAATVSKEPAFEV